MIPGTIEGLLRLAVERKGGAADEWAFIVRPRIRGDGYVVALVEHRQFVEAHGSSVEACCEALDRKLRETAS